eukprot:SAG22_NODE_19402_length_275_cov_0.687500_1_plen_91_part_11
MNPRPFGHVFNSTSKKFTGLAGFVPDTAVLRNVGPTTYSLASQDPRARPGSTIPRSERNATSPVRFMSDPDINVDPRYKPEHDLREWLHAA